MHKKIITIAISIIAASCNSSPDVKNKVTVPDYDYTSLENLKADTLNGSVLLFSGIDTVAGLKESIIKTDSIHTIVFAFPNNTYAYSDTIVADKENGGGRYRFYFKNGVDSGMNIEIDRSANQMKFTDRKGKMFKALPLSK